MYIYIYIYLYSRNQVQDREDLRRYQPRQIVGTCTLIFEVVWSDLGFISF